MKPSDQGSLGESKMGVYVGITGLLAALVQSLHACWDQSILPFGTAFGSNSDKDGTEVVYLHNSCRSSLVRSLHFQTNVF